MSHFTVLVIGQDPEKQLAPYHEFECTGEVDQYVQSIDQLQEAREEYASSTERRFKAPDGEMHDPYDARFYRDMTEEEAKVVGPIAGTGFGRGLSWHSRDWGDGRGYRAKIHFLPDGWEDVQLNTTDAQTFPQFIESWYGRPQLKDGEQPDLRDTHKWGWYRVDDEGNVTELVDRTNPNKKWDWYVLGGRWTGFFKMKEGARGIQGRPGILTSPSRQGHADAAFKMDIDFDTMRAEAEAEAATKFDAVRSIIEPHLPVTPWRELLDQYRGEQPAKAGGIDAAREAYGAQPAVQALRESDQRWCNAEDFAGDRADYIRKAGIASCMTFAIVKDGKWYECGSMGWWGAVTDEKDSDTWTEEFGKLVAELPDDTLLSVYDCHI
ncbi:hypothetical protein [Pseudomonas citronellolis]|uniref:hypothetical protein n=1 Tax=Pseudomonas citronellolis TaxID=53408 RepID=UPI0021C080FD|nr:hypothetical protein [Pseudomonas citronellolis]UXJ54867.1 hypothetical protein N5P21_11925 [Pseudomonas citronellolis]